MRSFGSAEPVWKAIVDKIAEATRKAMADQDLQRMFTNAGIDPDLDVMTPAFQSSTASLAVGA